MENANPEVAPLNAVANALTEMYGPMATPDSVKALLKALVNASKTFEAVEKGRTNPHLKNKYSDLGDVLDATKDALLANGLVIIQDPISYPDGEAKMVVRSRLIHEDGAMLMNEVGVPLAANANAQAVGSAITYGRRYGLKALLGVQDADDDGQSAARRSPAATAAPAPAVTGKAPPTEAQLDLANKLRTELKVTTPVPATRQEVTDYIRQLQSQKKAELPESAEGDAPEAEVTLGAEATKLLERIKANGGVQDEAKFKSSLDDLVKAKKISDAEAKALSKKAPRKKAEAATA